ncbi:major facilitator superfamily domain-containing protein [Cercophora scortea]|uniref:Major facilitator superfamily domain-containing protein n=1 Tax=Cercophora scortea TaxID=314031 RepID=A0AAE0IG18_9PEZI|nr:major facilitator superfamily domain-containing protein [Cercophora scortea]
MTSPSSSTKAVAEHVSSQSIHVPTEDHDAIKPGRTSHTGARPGFEPLEEGLAPAYDNAQDSDMPPPPDGGYGWVCTLCVFLVNANTWGVNASWGIFLDRYLAWDTFPEATRFEYAMIGGLSISQALLISPVVAASQRYLGTRYTMLLGSFVIFAGLFSASAASRIWQLFMSVALCFGWGMGLVYIPAMALLPPWFSSRRSLALGFATSGAGLGGLAYSLITGRLIAVSGPAWTWRVLSITSLVANVICSLALRESPATTNTNTTTHPRRSVFNPRTLAQTQIILVLCWGFLTEFGYVALWYSLPSYATSIGLVPAQGAVVQAVLSLGLGFGRPVVGYYSDRVGRINMALGMTLFCGVLCLTLWTLARSYAGLLAFAALAGVVSGTFWSTVNPVLAEVVGLADAGTTFGAVCFALVLPTTFAEAVALQLVQGGSPSGATTGSFLPSQVFVGLMFLTGAAALSLLRSWKIDDIERARAQVGGGGGNRRFDEIVGGGGSASVSAVVWWAPQRMFMPKRV